MSRLNRAAQFAPFAALVGYEDAIVESARATDQAIELSPDLETQLDLQISLLRKDLDEQPSSPVEVSITYFVPDKRKSGGRYDDISAAVKRIDDNNRRIILSDGRSLKIENIVSITITTRAKYY